MKKLLAIIAGLAFSAGLYAGDAGQVTLNGTGKCGKCSLGTAEKCTNVLEVAGNDGNAVIFTFTKNVSHGDYFCQGETPGLVVTGTIKQVDGDLFITAASVEEG